MRRDEPPPPDTVGGFRVLGRIGGGGMGSVFEGEEPNIQRRVAIKILRARLADDPDFVERFRNEARLANSVAHPAIVDVFSFGQLDDGRPYFVMPLLEGASVRELLDRERRLPPERAWAIAREVASALAAAHAAELIHRDLKPDNVFLEQKGEHERVRVMDFGIAKSVGASVLAGSPRTQTGVLLGTPAYMAPEQWWGAKLDARVDQYALGAMLFEMLSGEPPFDPGHESGVMKLHLHAPAPSLESKGLERMEPVDRLLGRLLAKEPSERFSSMTDVIAAGDAAFASVSNRAELGSAPTELEARSETDEPSASGAELGSARLELAPARTEARDPNRKLVPPARIRNRWLFSHALSIAATLATLGAVGYVGPGQRDPVVWFWISGWMAYPVVLVFVAAAILIPVLELQMDGVRRFRWFTLTLALGPALLGALGTYMGWDVVSRAVGGTAATDGFATFNEGAYEAGANRFMGFAFSAGLTLSLALSTALGSAQVGGEDKDRVGAALGVAAAAFALFSVALGAPSVVYVAVSTALIAVLCHFLPNLPGKVATEVERSVFAAFALFFASGQALERVAARKAVLWTSDFTRAVRVREILAAEAEERATSAAILFAVVLFVLTRIARLRADREVTPELRRHWFLGVVLLVVIGSDAYFSGKFRAVGAATREALSSQFALFAELDPPVADAMPASAFAPSRGAALQVTRTAVAVNGKEVTRLNAMSTSEGRRRVEDALFGALARASEAPLSCIVDRRVTWAALRDLLALSRLAGATEAELLFTRGSPPDLPPNGPPEVSWAQPSDFVAVRVSLGPQGLDPDPAKPLEELAGSLFDAARAGRGPVLRIPELPASSPPRDPR